MRAHAIRIFYGFLLVTSLTILPACVQPESRQNAAAGHSSADGGASGERVAELAQQLESVSRYAAHMEAIYAAQEAEILALRKQVTSLTSRDRAGE